MRISFRQGIVTAPPNFLQPAGTHVDLNIAPPALLMVAIADGAANYLHTERFAITNAWSGPFQSGTDYWLYWDLDRRTGVRTFGHTLLAPVDGPTAPSLPLNDQHWFDTVANKMKVWNGQTGQWVSRIRVFATKLQSGAVPISVSINTPSYVGTQVSALQDTPAVAGALMFDLNGDPIKRSNNVFFTTEDAVTTGISTAVQVKLGAVLIEAVATEAIPAFRVVRFSDFHQIQRANRIDLLGTYGIIERDVIVGDVVNVTMEGVVTNPLWDWTSVGVNTPLYVDEDGNLTPSIQPGGAVVAHVVDVNTVLLRPAVTTYAAGGDIPPSLTVQEEGATAQGAVSFINFVGGAITATPTTAGHVDVSVVVPPSPPLIVEDGGVEVDGNATTINFGTGLTVVQDAPGLVTVNGTVLTAGDGIDIEDGVISVGEGGRSAGTGFQVQIGDGIGNFVAVSVQPALRVLTSNGDDPPTWEPPQVSGGTVTSVDISGGTTGLSFSGGPIETSGDITMSGVLSVDHGGTGGVLTVDHGGTGGTTPQEAQENLLPDQTGLTGAALTTDGLGNLAWIVPAGTTYTPGAGIAINLTEISSTVADNTGLINRVTVTNGDGTLSTVSAGLAGQVLVSGGPSVLPDWQNKDGTVSNIQIVRSSFTGLYIEGGDPIVPPDPDVREITTTGSISLGGVLTLLHGGTGGTSAQTARNNILPSQTGSDGRVLTTDGANVSWELTLPAQAGNDGRVLTTDGTIASWEVIPSGTVVSVGIDPGTTGLTVLNSPITTTGDIGLGGVLAVGHGGTGANNASEGLSNLLPDQTDNGGKVLSTNGATAEWTTVGAGTVTSVNVAGGGTGLTFTDGPITTSGTISAGGVLAIGHGGTGETSASAAITALLPEQDIDTVGQVLASNGTIAAWTDVGAGTVTSVAFSGGTTGLDVGGSPITTNGTITLSGTLEIAHGGTGGNTAQAARNNLLPAQTGLATQVLTTDGSNVSWTTAGSGTVTSVDVDGDETGLTFTGGPISTNGTLILGGTLAIAHGGTGGITAQTARNNLLPSQNTFAGRVLTTNGTDVSWGVVGTGTVTSVAFSGGTTGLGAGGSPITTNGTITLNGTLAIAHGGTGATSAEEARNNLLPVQTTFAGSVLTTNGTDVSWTVAGEGTVSSINASGGTTGLTFTGGPITDNGTLTLSGTLIVANGGTGATTANAGLNNLLPSQTGNSGRVLSSNGADTTWSTVGSLTNNAGGATTQVLFNNSGSQAGDSTFTFNAATDQLSVSHIALTGRTFSTPVAVAASDINCALSNVFTKAVTTPLTWTFSTPPSLGLFYMFLLILTNGGAEAQTWPTEVVWAGGVAPTLQAVGVDYLMFSTTDAGATWRGSSITNFAS